MRILTVHNRYLYWGGEDESHQAQVRLLREHGHDVDVLLDDNARVATMGKLRAAATTVWASGGYQKIRGALRQQRYDLVELHNTFPLISPSAYYAARAEHVPAIQVLHNYRLACPGATLFRDRKPCNDCVGLRMAWPGVVHRCYRGSASASAVVAAMLTLHHAAGTWRRAVQLYVTPSEFARQKMIAGGLPADRVAVRPHFVHPDPGLGAHDGGYALFVGRLATEKGIATLLSAWEQGGVRLPLKIAGDGPLAPTVADAATRSPAIEWLGQRQRAEVDELMGRAALLIVPSEWYETFGLVAIEAFAKGTPVVAARIGAVAELVKDGSTGFLFEPGNAAELAAAVNRADAHPRERAAIGNRARAVYESMYTGKQNYARTLELYERVIAETTRNQG